MVAIPLPIPPIVLQNLHHIVLEYAENVSAVLGDFDLVPMLNDASAYMLDVLGFR